ncbi:hypothetical protein EDC18_1197 [Natranaerovirga pectinivora]|uniref:Uncharacterized protein n=1 Tax=Natranaerovirga pectinivora TaxID=682400 RepID=A0A4R3MGX8_9FIRM|nr:hypothetical protein [Natranaerovirga pectinivora]TCT11619.1 hypothetical protein EDC18_1197 [Natranaerovirga pectinivora]
MINNKNYKLNNKADKEFNYSNLWCVEEYSNFKRVTVAPQKNHVNIMLDLLKEISSPYWILYV